MSALETSAPVERSSPTDTDASPQVPGRRRWWVWFTAGLLVAGAVTGNAALITQMSDREPVLVLARDVPWGQPVSGDDVRATDLPAEVGTFAVRETAQAGIVGQVAGRNLHAGDLLAPSDLATQAVPGPGQRVLGLRLEPGRYPARGLAPNDPIAVHPAPDESTSSASGTHEPGGQEFSARVVRASPPDADGAITADVLIPESTAPAAVEAAVGGAQVSLLGPPQR
ncbi:SAF domain-containing protein [Saccharopolyspora gloriosae]|uniref:SAF domain-containing protein n=1 Tax=Saccharopolyspora gloriosae TaxID=455344 RepID=UPI001FB5BCA4|nr:SAF domain-containing protein [Saccharopolyspora gloriosae]